MNAFPSSPILGRGLYPLAEAARIAQLPAQTARRWAMGNTYKFKGGYRSSAGLATMELPEILGKRDLTFQELLTLRMVRAFRAAGLGLRTIKRVAAKAASDYGVPTPLVTKRFRTDGRRVFMELRQELPANEESSASRHELRLIDVLSGQEQFAQLVEPSLFRNLEWQDDWQASRWWPAGIGSGVVLDPNVLFGAPRLDGTSLPTEAVARSVTAEGGGLEAIEAVAIWHGITAEQVRQALTFETEWLSRAA